nr:hypothetical protein [uncultured Desulfuromonas sp.]
MKDIIRAEMTLLDIVSNHEETIEVFHQYDEEAGVCLCCTALFESVQTVATTYNLNIEALLRDLNKVLKKRDQA